VGPQSLLCCLPPVAMTSLESVVQSLNDFVIEVVDDRTYTFGSSDNVRRYQREELLGPRHSLRSRHAVSCRRDNEVLASAIIGAGGGPSGVHERTLAVLPDACLVAVGSFIVCLEVPHLRLRWSREVDEATCFGIHLAADGSIISHGELEISRLTSAGELIWKASGRDIFTGSLSVDTSMVRAEDFNGDEYTFDLRTGHVVAGPA
jgi:hypothetical protein